MAAVSRGRGNGGSIAITTKTHQSSGHVSGCLRKKMSQEAGLQVRGGANKCQWARLPVLTEMTAIIVLAFGDSFGDFFRDSFGDGCGKR